MKKGWTSKAKKLVLLLLKPYNWSTKPTQFAAMPKAKGMVDLLDNVILKCLAAYPFRRSVLVSNS